MSKQQKKLINIGSWTVVILFMLRCILSWKSVIEGLSLYELFGYASESISIAVIFLGIYENILWRYNPLEKTPKLAKRYVGTFKSNFDQVERKATLEIKQSLLSVHVTLVTSESRSQSISASIDEVLGEMQLIYCFLNKPKAEHRHRSEIHIGTAIFPITDPMILEGQYYTDRETNGDMMFSAE